MKKMKSKKSRSKKQVVATSATNRNCHADSRARATMHVILSDIFKDELDETFGASDDAATIENKQFINEHYVIVGDRLHYLHSDGTTEPFDDGLGYSKQISKIFGRGSGYLYNIATGVMDSGIDGDDRFTAYIKHSSFKKGFKTKSCDTLILACLYRLKWEKKLLKKNNLSLSLLELSSASQCLTENMGEFYYNAGIDFHEQEDGSLKIDFTRFEESCALCM